MPNSLLLAMLAHLDAALDQLHLLLFAPSEHVLKVAIATITKKSHIAVDRFGKVICEKGEGN
jgi:hypothetical protein